MRVRIARLLRRTAARIDPPTVITFTHAVASPSIDELFHLYGRDRAGRSR